MPDEVEVAHDVDGRDVVEQRAGAVAALPREVDAAGAQRLVLGVVVRARVEVHDLVGLLQRAAHDVRGLPRAAGIPADGVVVGPAAGEALRHALASEAGPAGIDEERPAAGVAVRHAAHRDLDGVACRVVPVQRNGHLRALRRLGVVAPLPVELLPRVGAEVAERVEEVDARGSLRLVAQLAVRVGVLDGGQQVVLRDRPLGLTGKAGTVKILDVVVSSIEQIHHFQGNLPAVGSPVADSCVQLEGVGAFHGAIPVQRTRGEVSGSQAGERPRLLTHCDPPRETHRHGILDQLP